MQTDYPQDNLLEIKDIAVAAYLYSSQQVTLIGTKRLVNKDVLFQFSPKEKARSLIQDYWNLKAPSIQPKQLFSAQRDLKDMIFGG
jgi:hypothetical protein